MSEQPLAGWTGFRWQSRVLLGADPAGRTWSIGEVLRDAASWVVEISDRTEGKPWVRARATTAADAAHLAPALVRQLGGDWPDTYGTTTYQRVLDYLRLHPASSLREITDGLAISRGAARAALARARGLGTASATGWAAHATWSLTETAQPASGGAGGTPLALGRAEGPADRERIAKIVPRTPPPPVVRPPSCAVGEACLAEIALELARARHALQRAEALLAEAT